MALGKLFFPNYDNLPVASMLAADLEFIIILKKQIQRQALSDPVGRSHVIELVAIGCGFQ